MVQFLTAVALDPTKVLCQPVQMIPLLVVSLLIDLTWLGYIDSGGRDGAFLLPLLLIIPTAVFFLIAPSFYGRLQIVGAGQSCQWFEALGLRFFHPGVFYWLVLAVALAIGLAVDFGRNGVSQPRASRAVLIYVTSSGAGP